MTINHMAFRNTSLPENERINDLLGRLTLQEKCGMLVNWQRAIPRLGLKEAHMGLEIARGHVSRDPAHPSTVFPQPIGMAAMFDPALMEKLGAAAGVESRIMAVQAARKNPELSPISGLLTFGPTIDMERHPLWGRTEEAYGEDPFLAGKMSAAYTRGLRGDHPYYAQVIPGVKHFFANNNEKNRETSDSQVSPRIKREYYYEPFRRCFEEGGAMGVMAAYNEVNGVPMLCSPDLQRVVKDEWRADFVMSDGGDFASNVVDHKHYTNHAASYGASLHAGADFMLDNPEIVASGVTTALNQGLITMAELDAAVGNVLRLRFRLGEFDPPEQNSYAQPDETLLMCDNHTALNRCAACEQMVLLENNGILPLDEKVPSIALVGPQAKKNRMDWYTGYSAYNVTIHDGLAETIGERIMTDEGFDVVAVRSRMTGKYIVADENGVLRADGDAPELFVLEDWGFGSIRLQRQSTGLYVRFEDNGSLAAVCDNTTEWFTKSALQCEECGSIRRLRTWNGLRIIAHEAGSLSASPYAAADEASEEFDFVLISSGIERISTLAAQADTVVVCLGNDPMLNGRETQDRPSLLLPASQRRLLEAAAAVNKRTILLLVSSYPYAITEERKNCAAVLHTCHAGPELGHAIRDTLFGKNNPAGRLPMTWYASDRELPDIMDYELPRNNLTYLYRTRKPLYPFGYGLSYTTFHYDNMQVQQIGDALQVEVNVTNTGSCAGEDVVQVYYRAIEPCVQRPLRQLCAFERRMIKPGGTEHFLFTVPVKELRRWLTAEKRFVVDTGLYSFMVGGNCLDAQGEQIVHIQGDEVRPRRFDAPVQAYLYDDAWKMQTLYHDATCDYYLCAADHDSHVTYLNVMLNEAGSLTMEIANPFASGDVVVSADGVEIGRQSLSAMNSAVEFQPVKITLSPCVLVQTLRLSLPKEVRLRRIWTESESG